MHWIFAFSEDDKLVANCPIPKSFVVEWLHAAGIKQNDLGEYPLDFKFYIGIAATDNQGE